MFRGRWIGWLVILISLTTLLAVGCSKEASRPGDSVQQPNLNDPFGGYTAQNEAPAFGDAALQASGDAEHAMEDPMNGNPDITRMRENPDSIHTYVVTMLWGILDSDPSRSTGGDRDTTGAVDWSGSFTLSRGGVIIASTIGFEGDDAILDRTDPQQVGWTSHTTTSFDGIRLVVYQPFDAEHDGSTDTVTIVAGSNTWTFLVNDLANLDQVNDVGPGANKFSIRSIFIEPQLGSRGFLNGAWLMDDSGTGGTFVGRWINRQGQLSGYVRGIFGTRESGERVYFGKYIDKDGNFLGFVRGHWDATGPDTESRIPRLYGWFRGEWLDAGRTVVGAMSGHWRAAKGRAAEGFFQGAWFTGLHP